MKKKVEATATTTIAAAETKISVVEFDLAVCLGGNDRGLIAAASPEGSAAMSGTTASVGTFLRGMRVRMSLRRFGLCGTGVGGAGLGETGLGGSGLNGIRLGYTVIGGTGVGGTGVGETEFGATALGESELGATWFGGIGLFCGA